ncbi:MAG: replicative DNA helicase [Akkermansia sp.]
MADQPFSNTTSASNTANSSNSASTSVSIDKKLELTSTPSGKPSNEARQVPQALGPEKSVLALMSIDPATYIGRCISMGMSDDYFYLPSHKLLWKIFQERYNKNEPVDIVSITQILEDRNQLIAMGGTSGLAEIYTYTTTGAYFDHHLEILRDKYVLRSIIESSNSSAARAFNDEEEVASLLDSVEADVLSIRERLGKGDEKSLNNIVDEAVHNIETFIDRKGKIIGLTTGFEELDRKSNGLKAGDMFVIAARPSMGKTSFLLNMVEHVALNLKKPTLMFSCEMPSIQIVERLLFAHSGVRRAEILKRGTLHKNEMLHFTQAVKELRNSQFIVDDTAAISISELRAKARRIVRDVGSLGVIGVDYLQLMRSHTKQAQNSREREIAEISAGLKSLAKELKVPVVVLAQLNRGPESRIGSSKGIPMMSDLRESGSIEQDADMVGLLYRSAYYAEDEEERQKQAGRANLHLAKNRNGPTGDVPLYFEAELMRFSTREADENDQES